MTTAQRLLRASLGTLLFLAPVAAAAQSPAPPGLLPGTINVKTIDTQKLLTVMSSPGTSKFIPIAAHRGFWRTLAENSTEAITNAYDRGLEAVEIDVRYASATNDAFTDPNALLVLSHDECVDRQTTSTGALRGNPSSKCAGQITGMSGATYTGLSLRNRSGLVTTSKAASFASVLQALATYMSTNGNTLLGPVLIVDLKDRDLTAGGFDAWREYLACLKVMKNTLPEAYWPAVLYKLKMNGLPAPAIVSSEIQSHATYGRLVTTIVPDDVTSDVWGPNGSNFNPPGCSTTQPCILSMLKQQYPPAIQQMELVPFNASDGTNTYIGSGLLQNYATYYQPNTSPEGVTDRFARCCVLAALIKAETTDNLVKETDIRGILDFSLFYNDPARTFYVDTITADNVRETLNFLIAQGYRTTSSIVSSSASEAPTSALDAEPSSLELPFAVTDTPAAAATTGSVNLVNEGMAPVTISGVTISGQPSYYTLGNNCSSSLEPNTSCTITLSYAANHCPANASGNITLSLKDSSGNAMAPYTFPWQTVSSGGTASGVCPAELGVSATALNFEEQSAPSAPNQGNDVDGPKTVTLTNIGGSTLTIQSVSLQGNTAGAFSEADDPDTTCAGSSLAPAATCLIDVYYTNDSPSANASLVITSNSDNGPVTVTLSGTALPVLSSSTSSLSFTAKTAPTQGRTGSTEIDGPEAVILTNTGGTSLNIGSFALGGSNTAQFTAADSSSAPCTGSHLAPHASCQINVSYIDDANSASATLSITSNDARSPAVIALTGRYQ